MRAFIGISLPEDIQKYLKSIQELLKKSRDDVKWIEPGNIHLTLKFLGEITQEQTQGIKTILEDVACKFMSLELQLRELGAFPKLDFARILWVGLDDKTGSLKKIAHDLDRSLVKLGIPKEDKPFSAHITLGRIKNPKKDLKLQELLIKNKIQNLSFVFKEITFFKSTLSSSGPVYETLYRISLKNNPITKIA
ncbi:MAG: RNA 2',3'-cyclic phosphodiesterase [Candidatus Omnitrophota bacterium]